MSKRRPLWITEAEVVELIDLPAAIAALESGLRMQALGRAQNMNKTHLNGPDWQIHAIGASLDEPNVSCVKSWVHTPGGATPLLMLWDSGSGALLSVIEAFALGQMRTGGISGVATGCMAPLGADQMALIGTGKQALAQLAAVAAVRPLKSVKIWGRDPVKQLRFAESAARLGYDFAITTPSTVAEATADASIVTLVTRAREPILTAEMARAGVHINAVGAITPEREEFTQDIFARTDLIAADDPDTAKRLSREFGKYLKDDDGNATEIRRLCDLVTLDRARPAGTDISIFKAMGMGVSDISLAIEIFERASANGAGREFAPPIKAVPHLR